MKSEDGKSLSGKGPLTDVLIINFAVCHGNAMSVSNMRKAMWAVYFDTQSSNSEPLHIYFPTGSESWSKNQKALPPALCISSITKLQSI